MPRTSERGGPQTRARISQIATRLFQERGFDAVTVAEVAREAGVSSVTVFNHFPRKEDLLFDRTDDAVALLRSTVVDRAPGIDVLDALEAAALLVLDDRRPLSGLAEGSPIFFRTVAASPVLVARTREIGAELQGVLRDALAADASFEGDAVLLSTFVIAGYGTVLVETARRLISGEVPDAVAEGHRERVLRLFRALREGVGRPF
ncbi:TetR/AcrR family transcriptional regulator [Leifsonia sp. NPDC058194]|uniref:TetR/AcrR family transcriptional regulator n=1 Tax=Leifsonia sp. NPDC058194 TaxID=3346374 RepID=UPI0036D8367F